MSRRAPRKHLAPPAAEHSPGLSPTAAQPTGIATATRAHACIVFFGVVYPCSPAERRVIEAGKDHRIIGARSGGFDHVWLADASPERGGVLCIGRELARLGPGHDFEHHLSVPILTSIMESTSRRLFARGFCCLPEVFLCWVSERS